MAMVFDILSPLVSEAQLGRPCGIKMGQSIRKSSILSE